MDQGLQNSLTLDYSNDDNSKYLADLSTILVATVEEVKDRISQIEFIFCKQLFPNFQSELARSRNAHESIADAMELAEGDWKKEENSLLLLIEDLRVEKQNAQEQTRNMQTFLEKEKVKVTEKEQLLIMHETEKKQLLSKLENLENGEIAELQKQLKEKSEEVLKVKELHEKLLQQMKSENDELELDFDKRLMIKKSKKRKAVSELRKLASQYNFILNKFGFSKEIELPCDKIEERDLHPQNQGILQEPKGEDLNASCYSPSSMQYKNGRNLQEPLEYNRISVAHDSKNFNSNDKVPPGSPHVQKHSVDIKFESLVGPRLVNSCWRETRSRQEPGGADPHDDFLNTPMENATEKLRTPKEEPDISTLPPKSTGFDNPDEETQEMVADPAPSRQLPFIPKPEKSGYKYVEPVRKKAERENLKGVECKQCKKFYDAVLADGGGNNNNTIRCEHHDGVSRHRYRHAWEREVAFGIHQHPPFHFNAKSIQILFFIVRPNYVPSNSLFCLGYSGKKPRNYLQCSNAAEALKSRN